MVDEPVWEIPVHSPKTSQSKKSKESSSRAEGDGSTVVADAGLPPWYPSGLTSEPLDPSTLELGIRTPLRMLIDGIYDERGTDKSLTDIERNAHAHDGTIRE